MYIQADFQGDVGGKIFSPTINFQIGENKNT